MISAEGVDRQSQQALIKFEQYRYHQNQLHYQSMGGMF